jgi:hypothetical protein
MFIRNRNGRVDQQKSRDGLPPPSAAHAHLNRWCCAWGEGRTTEGRGKGGNMRRYESAKMSCRGREEPECKETRHTTPAAAEERSSDLLSPPFRLVLLRTQVSVLLCFCIPFSMASTYGNTGFVPWQERVGGVGRSLAAREAKV